MIYRGPNEHLHFEALFTPTICQRDCQVGKSHVGKAVRGMRSHVTREMMSSCQTFRVDLMCPSVGNGFQVDSNDRLSSLIFSGISMIRFGTLALAPTMRAGTATAQTSQRESLPRSLGGNGQRKSWVTPSESVMAIATSPPAPTILGERIPARQFSANRITFTVDRPISHRR